MSDQSESDNQITTVDSIKEQVELAIAGDDMAAIARAQLEVQWITMQYLKQIDWKLSEIYDRVVK